MLISQKHIKKYPQKREKLMVSVSLFLQLVDLVAFRLKNLSTKDCQTELY